MRPRALQVVKTSFAHRSYSPFHRRALSSSSTLLDTLNDTKAATELLSEKDVDGKPSPEYYTVRVNLPGQPKRARSTKDGEGSPLPKERRPTNNRPSSSISGTSKKLGHKTDRPPQPQKDSAATGQILTAQLAGLRGDLGAAKTTTFETLIVSDVPIPDSANGIVKIIQLNRPKQRNALSSELIHELSAQISAIHAEGDRGSTRAVILASSSATAWCSGADLKERQGMSDEEVVAFLTKARETFNRITQLPVPVIAALSGYVLGGGMELALTAHIRYLASNLTMAFPETKSMGIIPGLGGTYRLPQIVARNQALELILTNRRIKTGRASYLGLGTYEPSWATEEKALNLDEIGQAEACLARALNTAKDIAQAAPLATRAVLAAMVSKERPKGEIEENMAYESLMGTQDRKEALTAFAEKRKPVFTGR